MPLFLVALLNLFYCCYFPLLSILYELCAGVPLLIYWSLRGIPLGAAARRHNELYGRWVVRGSWPILRITVRGMERIPLDRPVVMVANHRSFADIFFCAFVPLHNFVVMVRSWPFRIPVLGRFMRLARYVDLERTPMAEVLDRLAPEYLAEGTSFLFFPEGHRSRDGRLQVFRSGAFRLAARYNLPVAPLCLQGTERLTRPPWPLLRPAHITIEALPLVDPSTLPEENRAMKLKRAVEDLYRAHLGE